MVIINHGNPTGQVLDRTDLEMVAKFCAHNGIVLLADEVYERNNYTDRGFISAKKVVAGTPGCESVELISYHSTRYTSVVFSCRFAFDPFNMSSAVAARACLERVDAEVDTWK